MAPSPSHSQALLPRSDILILDRIERDADRFRLVREILQADRRREPKEVVVSRILVRPVPAAPRFEGEF
jgi:hypothetical protein